ncbi:MAG: hypothetical protein UZ13_02072, partial [Chloroflexi bacterium OLB13]
SRAIRSHWPLGLAQLGAHLLEFVHGKADISITMLVDASTQLLVRSGTVADLT